jgi:hypothetical protein
MDRSLFLSNALAAKQDLGWQGLYASNLSAFLFAANGMVYDAGIMRATDAYIRRKAGAASVWWGALLPIAAAKIALAEDGVTAYNASSHVTQSLQKAGFFPSIFLPAAAWVIASRSSPDGYGYAVERVRLFYQGLKARHPMIASMDDIVYFAMASLTPINIGAGVNFVEQSYASLKARFRYLPNANMSLAEIALLAAQEDVPERSVSLSSELKRYSIRMGEITLPSLGLSALLSDEHRHAAAQIADHVAFLRSHSLFRWVGRAMQSLFASAIYNVGASEGQRLGGLEIPQLVLEASVMQLLSQGVYG